MQGACNFVGNFTRNFVMIRAMIPEKLKPNDTVAVVAPSQSLATISQNVRDVADQRFADLGLEVVFGEHAEERDDFDSSSVSSRTADLHGALANEEVKAVLAVRGGWSANQLLGHIDWELIRNNPKVFCGFSNNTMLHNAIYAKTGLVTYYGPGYSTFGQEHHFDYTLEYFKKCLMDDEPFELAPSQQWSDDDWKSNQQNRQLIDNAGYVSINSGQAEGTIIGGCLCDLNLLQGTEYMPDLTGSVLFLEGDSSVGPAAFDRELQSLIHQSSFGGVKGIVFGRFQKDSGITMDLLKQIIGSKTELSGIPVIAGVDFGHTDPKTTFPIGGTANISADSKDANIVIHKH